MNLREDHHPLTDAAATRRYFAKFDRIIGHMRDVAAEASGNGRLGQSELDIVEGYLKCLSSTFSALSYKHLIAAFISNALPQVLEIDRKDSGFPVYRELLQMANDFVQAEKHLISLPAQEQLKEQMLGQILGDLKIPRDLQFALSQRIYYEHLQSRALFWPQNDPQISWVENRGAHRRSYLLHWAIFDSQTNLPVIYIMKLEDSGDLPLQRDDKRWPRVQSHLAAQSPLSLKLVTIASGFDQDFDDLHPKFLRRIIVGPMYSDTFTEQTGPLQQILAEAAGEPGLDWALAWTIESLISNRAERKSVGIFEKVDREIFELDHYGRSEAETGATETQRSLILPQRPYQILQDRDPVGLRTVRKYVVGSDGKVMSSL
ncbi:hypothetical protein [Kiloniella laminariae]|uniref:hypothetical protein n=1 Tax=Kiloniella laminariae TaxID=454162 RepID=UPI000370BB8A|nr:hypothetical protein [Kiloniella laminariae]